MMKSWMVPWFWTLLSLVFSSRSSVVDAFANHHPRRSPLPTTLRHDTKALLVPLRKQQFRLFAGQPSSSSDAQVWACGYSTQTNLVEAITEAVQNAVAALPPGKPKIDVAIAYVSSLYDGGALKPAATVLPTLLQAAETAYGAPLTHAVGAYCAGCIGSTMDDNTLAAVELEGIPAVSITLGILPDVSIQTFHVTAPQVPDGRITAEEFAQAIGIKQTTTESSSDDNAPVIWLLPSPGFSTDLDDLVRGLALLYPGAQLAGGLASTVSSLSRAVLWQLTMPSQTLQGVGDGCVGLVLQGDVQLQTLTAQGAKPVGGVYQVLKGTDSTIQTIVLDETATEALEAEEETEEEEEEEESDEKDVDEVDDPAAARERMKQAYAKARIPKPPLAEANFLMRTLSDDDQAFMRRQLLIGLEQGGSVGRTASELARLAQGQGHRFTVYQVATAGMKDGSVTLPLGRVDVQPGTRCRFFVREPDFAKKEVDALWMGYKKRVLDGQFDNKQSFTPAGVFIIPTLDRGSKFFMGKTGYESSVVASMIPGLPSISGFFSNGVIGRLDGEEESLDAAKTGIHGSASGYFLIGSKSGRPIYSPATAAAEKAAMEEQQAAEAAEARALAAEDEKRLRRTKPTTELNQKAPRDENGELILKRREVHSGRALTVSTVEWSVAEKTAKPTSTLEGFMWDKETEVDRFRERVPLANLVSQCRLSASDPKAPKPRDWIRPLKQAASDGSFVIVPECKRLEPVSGSLRRRYDLPKLVRDFTLAGAPVISVNCDSVLFGGSLEDVTTAREASASAAIEGMPEDGVVVPPILASDLLLYPYQLYKLRLAGADAVNVVAAPLESKDLLYLIKIASSVQLQTLVTVTSEAQLNALTESLPPASINGVILSNRQHEDFSFDMTGEQALSLLKSDSLKKLKEKQGDLVVLVEGRVGIIERPDAQGSMSTAQYLKELKDAGALGAIVGGGLTTDGASSPQSLQSLNAT